MITRVALRGKMPIHKEMPAANLRRYFSLSSFEWGSKMKARPFDIVMGRRQTGGGKTWKRIAPQETIISPAVAESVAETAAQSSENTRTRPQILDLSETLPETSTTEDQKFGSTSATEPLKEVY